MIKYLETTINGLTLRGTAHIPDHKQDEKLPVVLMFHGFGAVRDEYFCSFVNMSRLLEKNHICAIRFDFGCHGESDGDFQDFTFSKEISEGQSLIDYVKTLNFVDSSHISLMGMSLGSVAASIVAGLKPDDVHSLVLWSPAAAFLDEILGNHTLQGQSVENVSEQGYFDFHSLKLGFPFFDDLKKIDIYGNASIYQGPVKIIHGIDDWIAPISYSEKYVANYKQSTELVKIPGADHGWETVKVRQQLFDETIKFFIKNK